MELILEFTTFNSVFHVIFFILATGLYVPCLIAVRRGSASEGRTMSTFMTLFHVLVAFEAAVYITWISADRQIFSVHCIWFNLLMCLLYLRLRKRALRRLQTETDPF